MKDYRQGQSIQRSQSNLSNTSLSTITLRWTMSFPTRVNTIQMLLGEVNTIRLLLGDLGTLQLRALPVKLPLTQPAPCQLSISKRLSILIQTLMNTWMESHLNLNLSSALIKSRSMS
jgi:hypothetical protein